MATSANDLIADVSGLVTLPDVYLRINSLIENPNTTLDDIAEAISRDPSFTVRLLQVANSSLYGLSSTVSTVAKAVSVIGTAQVRNLALSISVANSFSNLLNQLVSMQDFWHHSLFCALAARRLAKEARRCDPDTLFTAGMLHDIGELVIFNREPEESKQALLLVLEEPGELPVYMAERQVFGFDHSEVGGLLARQWKLPPVLVDCIAHHHDIENAQSHPRETAIVHIANSVALMAELDTLNPDDVPPINPKAWEITGLGVDMIEPVMRAVQTEIVEVESLFLARH
ncbi:MAG: HDOD domain-containing protein [Burkholderiales bacterium]